MIVCNCRAVSEREVQLAILQGAGTIEAIGQLCGAGTDCGACHSQLEESVACADRAGCANARAGRCPRALTAPARAA